MVFGADRLLEPKQVQFLQHAAEPDRLRYGKAVVGIDRKSDVRPDRVAHRFHSAMVKLQIAKADFHLDPALFTLGRVDAASCCVRRQTGTRWRYEALS